MPAGLFVFLVSLNCTGRSNVCSSPWLPCFSTFQVNECVIQLRVKHACPLTVALKLFVHYMVTNGWVAYIYRVLLQGLLLKCLADGAIKHHLRENVVRVNWIRSNFQNLFSPCYLILTKTHFRANFQNSLSPKMCFCQFEVTVLEIRSSAENDISKIRPAGEFCGFYR